MTEDATGQAFQSLAAVAANRGGVYRFLSEAFRDPTRGTIRRLMDGSVHRELGQTFDWLGTDRSMFDDALATINSFAEEAQAIGSDQCLTRLKVEYARLFIGPPRAEIQPFASMHIPQAPNKDRLLNVGGSVRTVEELYRDAGLQVTVGLGEPPDHVSTEFEFLYYLCVKEQESWEAAENDAAREWRRRQREFIKEHLAGWCIGFLEKVEDASDLGYYQGTAALGRVFIAMEAGAFKPG